MQRQDLDASLSEFRVYIFKLHMGSPFIRDIEARWYPFVSPGRSCRPGFEWITPEGSIE